MKQLIILASLLIALPATAISQTPNGSARTPASAPASSKDESPEQAIKRLEGELNEALLQGNADALERILADGWVVKNPDTTQNTKTQLVSFIRKRGKPFVSIKDEDVAIHIYGNAAIASGRSTRVIQGVDQPMHLQFTRIYAKRPAGWQIVGMHFHYIKQ